VKGLIFIVLILFSNCVYSQNYKKLENKFWNSVNSKNNIKIIEIGEKLIIKYENNSRFDSSYCQIRIQTALGYANEGLTNKALDFDLNTLDFCHKLFLDSSKIALVLYNNIGMSYSLLGEFSVSNEYYLKSYELSKILLDTNSAAGAIILSNIATNCSEMGNYEQSLMHNKRAIGILEKKYGKVHSNYVLLLNNIAIDYNNLGNYKLGLDLLKESLELNEKIFGKNIDYAINLQSIGVSYYYLGEYQVSIDYLEEAIKIALELDGNNISDLSTMYTNLASSYSKLGDFNKTLTYNKKALEIRSEIYGKEHYLYAKSLLNVASDYLQLDSLEFAIDFTHKALPIIETKLSKNHPDYALGLDNLASCYSQQGDYEESIKLYLISLDILKQIYGDNHFLIATCLENIAITYSNIGEFNNSLDYAFKSYFLRKKIQGEEHLDCISTLINISSIYNQIGNFLFALEYSNKASDLIAKVLGKEHYLIAYILSNKSKSYAGLGDFKSALDSDFEALKINQNIFGKDHYKCQINLNNIGVDYTNLGEYQKALEYNLKSLEYIIKFKGIDHPDYALSLNNLAQNYLGMKDYSSALDYHMKALKVYEKTIGKEHPDYAFCLNNIGYNLIRLKDFSTGSKYLVESYRILENSFNKNRFGLNLKLLESLKESLNLYFQLNISILEQDSSMSQLLNNFWINLNGILYSNSLKLESQISQSGDKSLIEQLDKLIILKKRLLKINELTSQEKNTREINEQKLQEEINSIERGLSSKSKSFSNFNRYFYSNDISKNLNSNEYLVDFLRVPRYNFNTNQWTDSTQYLVFITDSKDTLVDYVFIEDGTKIDQDLFDQYEKEVTDPEQKTDLKSERFYSYFWKPIADKIGDAKTIYVSLGGVYNNINLNTIYNPTTGKYLVEEKDIRIVNSARDFVLSKESEKKNYTSNTASLFGFPNFDGNTSVTADSSDLFASTRDLNSFWLDSLTRGGVKAKPLPATKIELENISSTLKSKGWQVKSFLADNASETNIKKEASPRILHVATHGYFFQDIPLEKDKTRFLGMDRQQVVQDPMLRSGLLFTGANKTLKGESSNGENGLLSAAEASLLDLRETELVVLSACETGKGEVKNSEGVYGLRKAFSDAGAQNIIMSLWKVDDKVTQEFMSSFYDIWLNDKTSIRETFNKTQLEIKAKYPQPYYWGAFILVGE
jgi:CHAT domain-containing protein